MYMSYCRYEGTNQELNACLNDVGEHINQEAEYAVSDREILNFKFMVRTFVDFLNDNCLLTEDNELDEDSLEAICVYMSRKNTED